MDEKSLSMFTQYGQYLYLIFGLKVCEIKEKSIFLNMPNQTCNCQIKLPVVQKVSNVKE